MILKGLNWKLPLSNLFNTLNISEPLWFWRLFFANCIISAFKKALFIKVLLFGLLNLFVKNIIISIRIIHNNDCCAISHYIFSYCFMFLHLFIFYVRLFYLFTNISLVFRLFWWFWLKWILLTWFFNRMMTHCRFIIRFFNWT